VTIIEAFEDALQHTGLEAVGSPDGQVVIKKEQLQNAIVQTTVSGTVTDAQTGKTLPGVNILVVGTSTGAASDANGHYSVQVENSQDTLRFSFIGYQTQTVPIKGRTTIDVSLTPAIISGNQLVVIGYGKQKQKDITASIGKVNMESVSSVPAINAGGALQGQVPGLTIQRSGGRVGKDLTIHIRGIRSIVASNNPLIVVDNVPFNGSLSDIDLENVKSINVLKDAAATAVYGSRGSNGVILITTKKGSRGKGTEISYNGYYGISQPIRLPDIMNGAEFAAYKRESRRRVVGKNGSITYSWKGEIPPDKDVFKVKELEALKNGYSTDWLNLVLNRGHQQSHHLSFSGGNKNTQFYIAGNYLGSTGIIQSNGFKRYGLRVNLQHRVKNIFRIGVNSSLSSIIKDWNANPVSEALQESPLSKPYDENGNLIFLPVADGLTSNPLLNIQPGAKIDSRNINKIMADIFAELDLLDNLTYHLTFGPSITQLKRGLFLGSLTNQRRQGTPTAGNSHKYTFDYTLQNKLTYKTSFGNDNNNIKAMVLQGIEQYHQESSSINVINLPFESQKFHNLGTAQTINSVGSGLTKWQLTSFLGRINYNYKNKYILQLSGRADGSSRFAKGHKWGFFPGISLGWRVASEPFIKDIGFINNLKLRLSFGEVGNTAISPYQTKGRLARSVYSFNEGSPGYGYILNEIPNPALTWEITASSNIGLDFGFFNNRISGSLNYYISHTRNLLLFRQLPATSGYSQILQNIGRTKNNGVEVSLRTVNVRKRGGDGFLWTTDLNWSHNKNEVVSIYGGKKELIGNRLFVGHPIHAYYNYRKLGIWQKDKVKQAAKYGEVPGQIKVKDVNGDGKINGKDRLILGSNIPNWSAGMTNKFAYKGFDLSVVMFARVGQMLRNRFLYDYNINNLFGRWNNINVDYWTPDNPTNAFPRPNKSQQAPLYLSSASYVNGSYLKIKNINIGYSLPKTLVSKLGIDKFQIYAQVSNVVTFSRYKIGSPEIQSNFETESEAIADIFQTGTGGASPPIPSSRLYSIGINLKF
jgi:TonB-linked SusC/RagA family outer membrane protein